MIPTRVRPLYLFLTDLCLLRVVVPLHLVISFLPLIAVLVDLSFLLVLSFALVRAWLAFASVALARPSTRFVVLQVFRFLSTVSGRATVNSTP